MRASHAGCAFGAVEDFRFEELRCQINPQSGANGSIIVSDNVAALVDEAAKVDKGGSTLTVARATAAHHQQLPLLLLTYAPFATAKSVGSHCLALSELKYLFASVTLSKNT